MNLTQIVKITKEQKGSTYSITYGDMSGSPYYAVCTLPLISELFKEDQFSMDDLKKFVVKNINILCDDKYAVGTWVDNGEVYLDVIELFDKQTHNDDFIRTVIDAHSQYSGWDLELNKEILP